MGKHWFVIYTRSRKEYITARFLEDQGVEYYLPLQKKLRYWKDRKKWVDIPLIHSYIFVRIGDDKEYLSVLKTEGVVCFVTFEGKAAIVPDKQIEDLRLLLASDKELEVTSQTFEHGDDIQVKAGPLKGLEGMLVYYKNKHKVRVQIEHIGQSLLVEIDPKYLVKRDKPV